MAMDFDQGADLLLATQYAVFGVDAVWSREAAELARPRILRASPDVVIPHGDTRTVMGTQIIRVRRSELAAPAKGDLVVVGGDNFKILAQPQSLDVRRKEWTCEAVQVAA